MTMIRKRKREPTVIAEVQFLSRMKKKVTKIHFNFYYVNIEDQKNTIVGIGDVRKALKKNLVISTYEETKAGTKKGHNISVQSNEAAKVEKELRKNRT